MSENVIQINGKDYDTNTLSREQNYLVSQIKNLQVHIIIIRINQEFIFILAYKLKIIDQY